MASGLLFKLKHTVTSNYYLLLKSYLADRNFAVRHNNFLSDHHPIEAGVAQGSVPGPLLFLIFTADIPKAGNTTIASFADDVAVLSVNEDPVSASLHLPNSSQLPCGVVHPMGNKSKPSQIRASHFYDPQEHMPALNAQQCTHPSHH
jgi:hypothetical protein